jgi:hypothetical protein
MTPEQIAEKLYNDLAEQFQDAHVTLQEALPSVAAALRSYGDERARAMKAECERAVNETRYPQGADPDEWRTAMLMRDYCAYSVRSLPD